MLDEIDLGLIHALSLEGRASFTKLGAALEVSAQTAQRRYTKLQASIGLRVVAALDPAVHGDQQWLVRISASAAGAQSVARALAKRPDTSWVRLASGGTEIIAVVTATTKDGLARAPHQLLLRDIPKTAAITSVAAHELLYVYRGGVMPWAGRLAALPKSQQAALFPSPRTDPPSRRTPDADDYRLVDALAGDARLNARALAAQTGLTETSAARRVAALTAEGLIYFDLDLDDTAAFGVTERTFIWLSTSPRSLDHVGTTLAGHQQLAFVAAVTGPSNIVALALTGPPHGLHRYITDCLALIDTITAFETAPVLHTIKTVR